MGTTRAQPEASPSPSSLFALASQYQASCALLAAAKLDLFTPLEARPLAAKEVAAALALPPRGVERLLNGCVALQLVEKARGKYRLAPAASAFLVKGKPGYLGHWLEERARGLAAWARLDEAVRADAPLASHAGDAVGGMEAKAVDAYILGLAEFARAGPAQALAERLDLSKRHALLDIGGGHGVYAGTLARKHAHLRVVLLDLPPVLERARAVLRDMGLDGRVTLWAGDYKTHKLGNGFDAVLLSNVLQTEPAAVAKRLVKKAFEALNPGGLLAVQGVMTDADKASPAPAALFGLAMLLMFPAGDSYSTEEVRDWLESAGFHGVKVERLPPPSLYTLVTAVKPR